MWLSHPNLLYSVHVPVFVDINPSWLVSIIGFVNSIHAMSILLFLSEMNEFAYSLFDSTCLDADLFMC
jgi:hypothetical protein